ncbi:type II toxin-antitoxin system VapC family toxin [uncultured Enterovirga sp.]|uniref:type II toxin-antitoxin system VapC family toxin n=1 Tax=uncultured Enterovirga sp. TaxID=2026352 RepID=UPI0035CAEC6F
MELLLDSHIVLAMAQKTLTSTQPRIAAGLSQDEGARYVSAASLWEIAIKVRLGKLDLGMSLDAFVSYVVSLGVAVLTVDARHAIASVEPEPPTKDPFDRMLLAQCAVEGLQLVTVDRALTGHPLAWRPA